MIGHQRSALQKNKDFEIEIFSKNLSCLIDRHLNSWGRSLILALRLTTAYFNNLLTSSWKMRSNTASLGTEQTSINLRRNRALLASEILWRFQCRKRSAKYETYIQKFHQIFTSLFFQWCCISFSRCSPTCDLGKRFINDLSTFATFLSEGNLQIALTFTPLPPITKITQVAFAPLILKIEFCKRLTKDSWHCLSLLNIRFEKKIYFNKARLKLAVELVENNVIQGSSREFILRDILIRKSCLTTLAITFSSLRCVAILKCSGIIPQIPIIFLDRLLKQSTCK